MRKLVVIAWLFSTCLSLAQTFHLRTDGFVAPRTNILFDTLADYTDTNQIGLIWRQLSGSTGRLNLAGILGGRENVIDGGRNGSLVIYINLNNPDISPVAHFDSESISFYEVPVMIGANTVPDATAALEIRSTTGGLLLPRVTQAERLAIAVVPPDGLVVYQTDGTVGFYAGIGGAWVLLAPASPVLNPTDTFLPYRSSSTTFADSQLSRNSVSQLGFNYRVADEFGGNFSFFKQGRTGSATNSPASGAQLGVFGAGGWRGDTDIVGQQIQFIATENWSPTATGNRIEFRTIDNTTLTQDLRLTIDENGQIIPTVAAAPSTTSAGGFAFDNNAWAASRGALQLFDGTANTYIVAALVSDPPSNGEVPMWNTGGTITWETIGGGAGATNAITSINSLTNVAQTLVTGIDGTDFNIGSTNSTHTFNLPFASASSHGKLSSTNWTTFNNKVDGGTNLGTGHGFFDSVSGSTMRFNSLTNGPSTSSGISISSNANTLIAALDLNSLTTATPDPVSDKIVFYDTSAVTNRAVLIESLLGGSGLNNVYRTKTVGIAEGETFTDLFTITLPSPGALIGSGMHIRGTAVAKNATQISTVTFTFYISFSRHADGFTYGSGHLDQNEAADQTGGLFNITDAGGTYSDSLPNSVTVNISTEAVDWAPTSCTLYFYTDLHGPGTVTFL